MADGSIISSTVPDTVTQVRGEIAASSGNVIILRANGELVEAEPGTPLYLNDTISSHDDSSVFLLLGDQSALTLGQAQKLIISEELIAGAEQSVEYDVYERNEITQEELAQAIAEGRNIEELLEPTAAGDGALPNADTEALIIYQRTADALIPVSGFETSTFTNAIELTENDVGRVDDTAINSVNNADLIPAPNLADEAPVADSSAITVDEDSTGTALGLEAPTDTDTPVADLIITVTELPTEGTIYFADGVTEVTEGAELTAAELAGLVYDAPTDVATPTDVTFAYTVDDGTNPVSNGSTTISLTPVNDAPEVTNSTLTIDEDDGLVPINIPAPTDTDTDLSALVVTITGLPDEGTVTLSNGDEVFEGDEISVEQLQGLNFEAPADFGSTTDLSLTYEVSDGDSDVEGSVAITVNPIADQPTVTIDASTPEGGLPLPESTGLVFSYYDELLNNDRDASTIEDAQAAATATSVEHQFVGFGNGDIVSNPRTTSAATIQIEQGDSYSVTGLIYLEAGQTYSFSGYADDSFRIELGGDTLITTTGNTWGNFGYDDADNVPLDRVGDPAAFEAPADGYYTLEMYFNNVSGPGHLAVQVSVNDGDPQALNADNFNLYANAQDIVEGDGQFGNFIPGTDNADGGYLPVELNTGLANTPILLSNIVPTLADTDGSESITAIDLSGIPIGATLTDANGNTFTAAAGSQQVNVVGWDLASLQISAAAGTYTLNVTATSEENDNGDTAVSATQSIEVTVLENTTEGALGGIDSDIASSEGVDFGDSEIITGTAANDNESGGAGDDGLIGNEGDDTLNGEAGEDYLSGGAGNDILSGGADSDIIFGGTGSDTMSGGTGVDTFTWAAGDGANGETDTITDFTVGEGGDVLNLSDLLEGESETTLDDYLTVTSDGTDTTITVDTNGLADGGDSSTIILQGVDLAALAGSNDNQAMIDALANNINVDNL